MGDDNLYSPSTLNNLLQSLASSTQFNTETVQALAQALINYLHVQEHKTIHFTTISELKIKKSCIYDEDYSNEKNIWEPKKHLIDCPQVIARFDQKNPGNLKGIN